MNSLPDDVLEFWKEHVPGAYLAGGAVRCEYDGTEVSDYDFFFLNKKELIRSVESENFPKDRVVFCCPTNQLVSLKIGSDKSPHHIQIICKRKHEDIFSLLQEFDFTAACMARSLDGSFYALPDAVTDAKEKTLRVAHNLLYPVSTMKRMQKYFEKGYKAHPSIYVMIAQSAVLLFNEMSEEDKKIFLERDLKPELDVTAPFYDEHLGPFSLSGID